MRVFLLLLPVIATTLAGTAVVVALVSGLDTLRPILIAAAAGGLVGLPVTWVIARKVAAA